MSQSRRLVCPENDRAILRMPTVVVTAATGKPGQGAGFFRDVFWMAAAGGSGPQAVRQRLLPPFDFLGLHGLPPGSKGPVRPPRLSALYPVIARNIVPAASPLLTPARNSSESHASFSTIESAAAGVSDRQSLSSLPSLTQEYCHHFFLRPLTLQSCATLMKFVYRFFD